MFAFNSQREDPSTWKARYRRPKLSPEAVTRIATTWLRHVNAQTELWHQMSQTQSRTRHVPKSRVMHRSPCGALGHCAQESQQLVKWEVVSSGNAGGKMRDREK